jgi:hypothetical protein
MKKQKKRDQKSFKKQLRKRTDLKFEDKVSITLVKKQKVEINSQNELQLLEEIDMELDKLNFVNFINEESITNRTDLRYIISTLKIPVEIRKDVLKLMGTKQPKLRQCLLYSKFVSTQIPGVNQIFGFFQLKEFQKFSSQLPTNKITFAGNSLYFKDEKEKVWGIHSWNEYKGVHFDCLKDTYYDFNPEKDFIKYTIVKKEEVTIKPELSIYFNNKYEFISSSMF